MKPWAQFSIVVIVMYDRWEMIFHLFEVQKHNFFTFGIIVMTFDICIAECDEYIRIFEYSNIFDPNIYSDIRSYHFLDTNIFG